MSLLIVSALAGKSFKIARTSLASSNWPFITSHLGDSGSVKIKAMTVNKKTICIANGKRQLTVLPMTKKKPKSSKSAMTIPSPRKIPSALTKAPLCSAPEISDCQTGMVAV